MSEPRQHPPARAARAQHQQEPPQPPPGWLVGSVVLLLWILGRPRAWAAHLQALGLSSAFCLGELQRAQLGDPRVRRLLVQVLLIVPLLTSLTMPLWFSVFVPGSKLVDHLFSPVGHLQGALLVELLLASVFSVAGGVIGGVVCLLVGQPLLYLLTPANLPAGLMLLAGQDGGPGGLCQGLLAAAAAFAYHGRVAAARQRGSAAPGIALGLLVAPLLVAIIFRSAGRGPWQALLGLGALTLALTGVQRRRQPDAPAHISLLWGLALAAALGLTVVLLHGVNELLQREDPRTALTRSLGLAADLLGLAALLLPGVVAELLGGGVAAAVAGALGGAGGWLSLAFLVDHAPPWPLLPAGVLCILLGLTLPLWRPLFSYPFLLAFHQVLLRLDQSAKGWGRAGLLRWHAAFWDEEQRLPFLGLEQHLLLCYDRDPAAGRAALRALRLSTQAWAVRRVDLELLARRLLRCTDTDAIAACARRIAPPARGPLRPALRALRRISQDTRAALNQGSYHQRLTFAALEERLDLLEQTLQQRRGGERLLQVVARWRRLLQERRGQLAREAALAQEIDNPYVVGPPLQEHQHVFVGRGAIAAQIEQLLLQPHRAPLLLYGQRRAGKTSLLRNLNRLLPGSLCPLFVDLQGPLSRAQNHAGFLFALAAALSQQARLRRGLTLLPLSREALQGDPFVVFEAWLEALERQLLERDQVAILALDEFEQLESAMLAGRLDRVRVLGMLRHLIQHRGAFRVLIAGAHTLDEVALWSSYLINVQTLHLGVLERSEAERLIRQPVAGFPLSYPDEALCEVLRLTGCHPYLLQLLCDRVVSLKNRQPLAQRYQVQPAEVTQAAAEALQQGSMFFADIAGNQVSAEDLPHLLALAQRGPGARLDPALPQRRLRQREIVDAQGAFTIELVRLWFVAAAQEG